MSVNNLFTTSESPKYSNPPIFCCLQNFVFFLIKSRAKYWNHATFSNSDSMGVQLKALKYVLQNYFQKIKTKFFGQFDNSNLNILEVPMPWTSYMNIMLSISWVPSLYHWILVCNLLRLQVAKSTFSYTWNSSDKNRSLIPFCPSVATIVLKQWKRYIWDLSFL